MNRRRLLRLWGNAELANYIKGQAARHFACSEDREDAVSEAWERIEQLKRKPSLDDCEKAAYNAIVAMYRRERRRNVHITLQKLNLDGHG